MSKTVTLKKNEDHRIKAGHLWIFSNEILRIDGSPEQGDIVQIRNHAGLFLGVGFYNAQSLIAVRLLTRDVEEIDFRFFRRKIEAALRLRQKLYPTSVAYRLIHGESDDLPGLIVDKYGDLLVVQTLAFGMERRLTLICDVLESLLHPEGIIERNESHLRLLEGMPQKKGVIRGSVHPVEVAENGIRYQVDLLEGQKTGFFLDQRENRASIRKYAAGARVLDCFSNEGGFGLNAASAGAASVLGVDISEPTVERANSNARLNGLESKIRFVAADAFAFLADEAKGENRYDLIILDPPSFAKNKKSVTTARQAYRELHSLSLGLLSPGGILATASCSHHITGEAFMLTAQQGANMRDVRLKLLEWHGASPDHPVIPAMPETQYLKFGIFEVRH